TKQMTCGSGTSDATARAFHPETGELWAVVQERDGLGDNLPSDYLIRVQQGGFYGWPYAYIGKHPMPGFANLAPDKVEATITPDLLFQAHSSVLDLIFYEGEQFPPEYKGSLFVAFKGSWNRSVPTARSCASRSRTAAPRAGTRISRPASGRPASSAPRSGAAPPPSPSPRTARCSSPTTPAARSGASPTRARLNTPPRRQRRRDLARKS